MSELRNRRRSALPHCFCCPQPQTKSLSEPVPAPILSSSTYQTFAALFRLFLFLFNLCNFPFSILSLIILNTSIFRSSSLVIESPRNSPGRYKADRAALISALAHHCEKALHPYETNIHCSRGGFRALHLYGRPIILSTIGGLFSLSSLRITTYVHRYWQPATYRGQNPVNR